MNLSAPVLFIIGPLVVALVALALGRWPRIAAAVGGISVWILWLMAGAVLLEAAPERGIDGLFAGDTFFVFGRSLLLTAGIQGLFQFFYFCLGLLFFLSIALPQGRHFVPGSLAVVALLAASLMMQPFTFGVLLLLAAAACLLVVIQAERAGVTQAALRYLILTILAVPLFLVAGWMLEREQASVLVPASRLILTGAVVLLAGFPFHLWVVPLAGEAPRLVVNFVFSLVQLAVAAFIFQLLLANPWLQQEVQFLQMVRWSGAATVLLAGLLALAAQNFTRLLGSLLLLDMGMAVLTLALEGIIGWQTTVILLMARFVSLLLAGIGLSLVRRQSQDDSFSALQGLGRHAPFSATLLAYGCLSLLGLPLTPGFAGRWAVIVSAGPEAGLWLPLLLLVGLAACAYALLRALLEIVDISGEGQVTEPLWLPRLVAALLILCLWLSAFPHSLLAYASHLAELFG